VRKCSLKSHNSQVAQFCAPKAGGGTRSGTLGCFAETLRSHGFTARSRPRTRNLCAGIAQFTQRALRDLGALDGWQMYERVSGQANAGTAQHRACDFLVEPIPVQWLEAAAKLPGRSLHVGLVLWYAAGWAQSASVHLSNVLCLRFGVDRNAKYRALFCLEDAGLIGVSRKRGRSPLVTILDVGGAL
jgi:hypothetical protein